MKPPEQAMAAHLNPFFLSKNQDGFLSADSMNKLEQWNRFAASYKSDRLRRWLMHPVLSYIHRAHSLEVMQAQIGKKLLEKQARLFWGDKMLVTLPEEVSSYIYRYQFFEPELTTAFLQILRPGMTFLDIGAHYGYFSKLAAYLVGTSGRVFSIEPVPSTFQILQTNVAGKSNVMPFQKAAFSSTGRSRIRDYGLRWSAFNSFTQARSRSVDSQDYQEVSVDIVRIDDLAKEFSFQPDFVKIDVESAEQHVLQGMLNLIETTHPILSVEVGDEVRIENVFASHDLIKYVCQLGYEPYFHNGVQFVRHSLQKSYWYGNLIFFPCQNETVER